MTRSDAPAVEEGKSKLRGFRIYRTTYHNQMKWERFVFLLTQDAEERLAQMEGSDPHSTPVELETVENADILGDASWEDVRAIHDDWVGEELRRESDTGQEPAWLGHYRQLNFPAHDIQRMRTSSDPRRAVFVFGDEASVNSVVDSDAANKRGARGVYYIGLVRSLFLGSQDWDRREMEEDEEEEDEEDELQRAEEEKALVCSRFKGWDLAALWTVMSRGNWPEIGTEVEDGIYSLVGF